jgi:hypothetical protein
MNQSVVFVFSFIAHHFFSGNHRSAHTKKDSSIKTTVKNLAVEALADYVKCQWPQNVEGKCCEQQHQ